MNEITYDDIKRQFSKEDLKAYDLLCKEFIKLTIGKNNKELWNLVQYPSALRVTLDTINKIRDKYDFLKGSVFFEVWTMNPQNNQYEEMNW